MRLPFPAPLLGLLGAVAALCLPLIFHSGETNYTWDETNYYLPAIRQIRTEWPKLDLQQDALSATAPGYPYLLAGISRLIGDNLLPLRLLNLGLSLLVLVVLWQAWEPSAPATLRFLALAPLAGSNFFIKSASNVVTDNAALLTVSGALVLILAPRQKLSLPLASATTTLAVFFRQSAIWLELPLALQALASERSWRAWPLLWPVGLLLLLVLNWGGLVPPAWQAQHRGEIAFAAGAYQLALIAGMGGLYLAVLRSDWRRMLREPWSWWGAAAGLVLALAGPNNPSYEAGRWGGYLWDVATRLPVWHERSLFFVPLAAIGGFVAGQLVAHLWRTVGKPRASIWIGAQLAFLFSGLANRQVYQRYFEPTQLALLTLWLALMTSAAPAGAPPRLRPLMLLGLVQLGLTLLTAHARTFHWL